MEGEAIIEAEATKKRAKAPKPKKVVVNFATVGGKFVCALTGNFCGDKAIVTTTYPHGAFCNVPALLRHAMNTLPPEAYAALRIELAKEFHQPIEVMIPCGQPHVVPLPPADFPGIFTNFSMWDAHTQLHGVTLTEWETLRAGNKTQKKVKAEKPTVVHLETGAYVIKTRKGEPIVEKLDGNKDTAIAVKHLASKPLDGTQVVFNLGADYHLWACAAITGSNPEDLSADVKSNVNILGSQMLGALTYGSVVVLSFKKQQFKLAQ